MPQIKKDLSSSRILVTNDDGVDADGIVILESIARELSNDVWVVAPKLQHSGAGHSITLHHPIRSYQLSEHCFAVTGTPTDSVLMGIKEIIPTNSKDSEGELDNKPVELVLSGINLGMNIADDVTYSGTIAAAMEASLLNVPAIAFSQSARGKDSIHWETAEHFTRAVIKKILGISLERGALLSVNIPNVPIEDVKGIRVATQGQRKIVEKLERRLDPKGRPYYWIGNVGFDSEDGDKNSDIMLLKDNYVTITPLTLDLTNYDFIDILSEYI